MQAPYFGSVAQELGYLTPVQLEKVLSIQEQEDRADQTRRRIGAICLDLGFLSEEQVDAILEQVELKRWLRSSVQGKMSGSRLI